ncbi:Alkyldihydroxyacetonephosphate synthase [hydrothermal vent metagenome]|uniref:Alkyldihydroxyacetonephosphate synthase n=1 Tax=hydrothermal vent metagenome TaxID=652676 RepID=A0A3B0UT70_9ZZZZ
MKRWNGWGDTAVTHSLPENANEFLTELVGEATPPQDAALADVVATVPDSRLPEHPLIQTDAEVRLRHARGQSFPDWVALRSGRIPTFPDGVAFPQTEAEVLTLLQLARSQDIKLIPYGGGTSVVGHINPEAGSRPVLTVNLQRLSRLLALDSNSQLATFGAGIAGPEMEAQLRAKGFTLGHFPQSFEYSTLGGWVVTRSSGQQSRSYGRIEDLFAGGKLLAPAGELIMPPLPASAAGPDLRQIILGSEGRLGIVTEAIIRISPLPEKESFNTIFFPNFEAGKTAVRQMVQAGLPLSMLRLSTGVETETTLKLAGHERLIGTLERLLGIRGVDEGKSMLMIGFSGERHIVNAARKEAISMAKEQDGIHVGQQFGNQWQKGRFRTPYLRNVLWELGYGVDTLETAVTWNKVEATLDAIETSLQNAMGSFNERIHVFTHLSHMYSTGCSIYTTYLFRLAADPDENLARWTAMKTAASLAIVQHGGTISHQHGVGKDHQPYLLAEKGELGIATLEALARQFDPVGIMNPGTLLKG